MVICLFLSIFLATQATEIGLQQPLELKAYLDAPKPWYPMQEGKILYQIRYQGKIQLTEEQLPLLEPGKGFEKVGDKVIENYDELNYSVQNISQKLRPTKSGHIIFAPSHVEGFLYEIRAGNIVQTGKVHADLPAYEVDVATFPLEGQPAGFNGSVGSFQFSLDRNGQTQTPTQVGDWITLTWNVEGPDLSGLRLPNIACLPGIVGFFRLNDLPITVTENGNKRSYTFQIAPLVPGIQEIPPLAWSFFDPKTEKYSTWKSRPIPLKAPSQTPSVKKIYPHEELPLLSTPNEKANILLEEGEIPLSLLQLQRAWRRAPWSREIPASIHAIEERAGLPLSDFPLYSFILRGLLWLLLPFTAYALWKRSIPLLISAFVLSLFLLWGHEKEGIILTSTMPVQGSATPFLAGETVKIHSEKNGLVLVSSKRQIGQIDRSALIDI